VSVIKDIQTVTATVVIATGRLLQFRR